MPSASAYTLQLPAPFLAKAMSVWKEITEEAILDATQEQLLSRARMGEALGAPCIERTLRVCIDAWNQQFPEVNELIAKKIFDKYRHLLEDQAGNADVSASWQINPRALIKPVDVSDPKAIKKLGSYIYIHIYIYIYHHLLYIYISYVLNLDTIYIYTYIYIHTLALTRPWP